MAAGRGRLGGGDCKQAQLLLSGLQFLLPAARQHADDVMMLTSERRSLDSDIRSLPCGWTCGCKGLLA